MRIIENERASPVERRIRVEDVAVGGHGHRIPGREPGTVRRVPTADLAGQQYRLDAVLAQARGRLSGELPIRAQVRDGPPVGKADPFSDQSAHQGLARTRRQL